MGPSPDLIFDVRLMEPNIYPEGMKRDYCSYSEAFWGKQDMLPGWFKNELREQWLIGGMVLRWHSCVWPGLSGLKSPPAPKDGTPGLAKTRSDLRHEGTVGLETISSQISKLESDPSLNSSRINENHTQVHHSQTHEGENLESNQWKNAMLHIGEQWYEWQVSFHQKQGDQKIIKWHLWNADIKNP